MEIILRIGLKITSAYICKISANLWIFANRLAEVIFQRSLSRMFKWGKYGGILALVFTVGYTLITRDFSRGLVDFAEVCVVSVLLGIATGITLFLNILLHHAAVRVIRLVFLHVLRSIFRV